MSFGTRPWILSVIAMPLVMLVGCVSITPLPDAAGAECGCAESAARGRPFTRPDPAPAAGWRHP